MKHDLFYFPSRTKKEIDKATLLYCRYPFLRKEYSFLNKLPLSPTILDIGCGKGYFLMRAKCIRPDACLTGVDKDNYLEIPDKEEIKFVACDLENQSIPLDDESFDFICCIHVIEHIRNPLKIFHEIFRLLKKSGIAYLEAPNVKSIFMPSIPFAKLGGINFYDDPTHIRPYTTEALRRLALISGFNHIKVFTVRHPIYIVTFPYLIYRFFKTGDADYLREFSRSLFGLDVGCLLTK